METLLQIFRCGSIFRVAARGVNKDGPNPPRMQSAQLTSREKTAYTQFFSLFLI